MYRHSSNMCIVAEREQRSEYIHKLWKAQNKYTLTERENAHDKISIIGELLFSKWIFYALFFICFAIKLCVHM